MNPATPHSARAVPAARDSNPFATRFIRPAARKYLFAEGTTAEQLVDRLAASGWRGQIVGPHGSGKSTLLETLLPVVTQRGRRVFLYRLRDGQRTLPALPADRALWSRDTLPVVDGYEQLSRWSRWRLGRWCRRAGCGMLITTHRPLRWPVLLRTETSVELLQRLVEQLLSNAAPDARPTVAEVQRAYEQHTGNLREALLQLYDVFETRRQAVDRQGASA